MSTNSNESNVKKSAGRIVGKIFSYIGIGICALLVVLIIWLGIDKFILKSPIPSVFGYSTLRVATGSMTGTIDQGSFVVIKDTGDYEINDIVTFFPKGDSIPTTHRIIGVDEEGKFITKGDNPNNSVDREHISNEQIVGEYVFHVDTGLFFGWIFEMGWIYILAAVLIIAMGILLIKYDDAGKKQAENRVALEDTSNRTDEKIAETATEGQEIENGDNTDNTET